MDRQEAPPPAVPRPRTPGPYEPNAVLRWLYDRFFTHITVDERWSEAVRAAAARGLPVYVMRSISFLDFLCLDFLTKQFGLPLIRFVNDLGLGILEPFGKGRRRLRLRRQIPEDRALKGTLADGGSGLLFLRRPPSIGEVRRHGSNLEVDLIRTLIEAQRTTDTPILLVPQTFVWSRRPPTQGRSVVDLLFGSSEWPGRVRVFLQFVLNFRNALLRTGEPFDLKDFLARHPDHPDDRLADKVRYALLTRIERERSLVFGPERKSSARLAEEIIRSPRIRPVIEHEAQRTGRSIPEVERTAGRELAKMASKQEMDFVGLLHVLLDRLWNRIYDGLEVDREGLERVRDAGREGPLVFLPSHKSHIDYLVLSDVFYAHDISPPLIAAGENLSFWPLGGILRRGGAFFIRRSFKGKKLYAALVAAYVRKLIAERFNIEFFIEGGRSRTGKLLPPKYGLLSMVVEAALQTKHRRVQFVPISIGYERIIEARSYVEELTGGEKKEENIGGLLRTPRVLRSRYGRLYVQFGDIVPLDRVRAEIAPPDRELTPAEERALVQRIAHQVVHQINRATVVTPASLVATALLAAGSEAVERETAMERARLLVQALRAMDARFATSLLSPTGALREETMDEAIRLFSDAKLVLAQDRGPDTAYVVPEERRIALEYFKNNLIHYFTSASLIAVALDEDGGRSLPVATVRARVADFSRLFKYEFMFRADATFDQIFGDALAGMEARGEVLLRGDTVQVSEGAAADRVRLYADMVRTYFESYRLALRGAELLTEGRMARKDWLRRTLAVGQRMYLAGEIERRESVSKPRLENALRALHDLGVVRVDGEQIEAGDEAKTPGFVEAARTRFLAFASR